MKISSRSGIISVGWRQRRFGYGTSPPVPEQFASIYDAYTYKTKQISPDSCSGLASLYGNGIAYYKDLGGGSYCGNLNTGYTTLANKERRLNLYGHAMYDIHDNMHFYTDVLYGKAVTQYTYALNSSFYNSSAANPPYYITSIGATVFFIRGFSPEERGGTDGVLSRQSTETLFTNLGLRGTVADTSWNYDLTYTHSRQALELRRRAVFAAPVERYFASILGPRTGSYKDPFYGTLASYADLSGLFAPIPASAVDSFYGYATSKAKTKSNWGRALATSGHLFALPGGDAGMALAVEGGNESWRYTPDAGFSNKTYYGYVTDIAGDGNRSYLAGIGELRLPVLSFATLSGSLRYDRYFASGIQTGRASYNVAGEVTPFHMLTLRARYGTAFKAPTLADLYQGESSQLAYAIDLARCVRAAGSVAGLTNCQIGGYYTLRLSGNTALRSITASVADFGAVIQPARNITLSVCTSHARSMTCSAS